MPDPLPDVAVDRTSQVPLYLQVAAQLERAIADGALPAGSRLPNELELADQLALSRPTLRQAISHLVDKGLVVRKRGVGTQVVGRAVRRPLQLSSLHDDLEAVGQRPETAVRVLRTIGAPKAAADALGVASGSPVMHVSRLRTTSGEPLALLTNYLPTELAEQADLSTDRLEKHGLYDLLRAAGIRLRVAQQTIGATRATKVNARDLDETTGAPLLTMTRIAYDDTGRAVEYGTHLYRASRYSFELTLVDR